MSLIKNIRTFKNWYMFYLGRYGMLRKEFIIVNRNGAKIAVRPNSDDLKIVKSNWVTKHYIREFIPIEKNSIVIDVGAHIGSFSIIAARYASKVFAFEPVQSNYKMLVKNVRLNELTNVMTYEMAVWKSSGYKEIYIYDETSTGNHSLINNYRKINTKKEIQTISLKDFLTREKLSLINFLKLDCEGAEYEIITDMDEEIANKIKYIVMETHQKERRSIIEIESKLKSLGYKVKKEQNGGYIYAKKEI